MSQSTPFSGSEIIYLSPEQVISDERYNVRLWSDGGSEEEAHQVELLAETIERDGQIDAAVVIPSDGSYICVVGNRRKRAISMINERRTRQGKPLLKLRVVVDRSGDDPLRKAIVSNLHRRDFTPMDMAALVKKLRDLHDWHEYKGAKEIAHYLQVDVATVCQYERFLDLDVDIQKAIHEGVISCQSGFDLLNVSPERRADVLKLARSIQDVRKPSHRIEHPAIVDAIRETKTEQRPIARSRREILEWLSMQDGPGNGLENNPCRLFCRYFVETWAKGEGSEDKLQTLWFRMTATERKPSARRTNRV